MYLRILGVNVRGSGMLRIGGVFLKFIYGSFNFLWDGRWRGVFGRR